MQTTLRSSRQEVAIQGGGPFVIIGEKINPSADKRLAAALREHDYEYVVDSAVRQLADGATVVDVNVGSSDVDEVKLLPVIARLVTAHVEAPICLDSQRPEALAAALAVTPGKPLVNSVQGDEASLKAVLPIVKDRGAAVIGLTMDSGGIPADAEGRMAVAERILAKASGFGIPSEDVLIDPLVLSVGADSQAAVITLRAIELITRQLGVNVVLGASNVSFGLPDRRILNQAFLTLAIRAGATCAITDPAKMTSVVRAVELLIGHDHRARRYLSHWRAHRQPRLA